MQQTIYLAAGCFWGTQAYFDLQKGVIKTEVGYANGNQDHVTMKKFVKEILILLKLVKLFLIIKL